MRVKLTDEVGGVIGSSVSRLVGYNRLISSDLAFCKVLGGSLSFVLDDPRLTRPVDLRFSRGCFGFAGLGEYLVSGSSPTI